MVKQWEHILIGDCFDFKNGLNKGKEFFGKGTPIINYTDVYKKRCLYRRDIYGKVSLSPDEINRFRVKKNDVFFTRTSETPEEVGYASVLLEDIENCVFSGFVLKAHPKNDKFFPPYCKYCFMTPDIREAITKSCTYTTRALTNGRQLSEIGVNLPPLPEQQHIAETLTDIDELIDSLEKIIAKKKAIKQGVMQELLTGKRRLPGFSREWRTNRLAELAEFPTTCISLARIDSRDYVGTENMIPNVGGIRDNTIALESNLVREFRKNDILLSNIRPYLHKIWYADKNGGCSNDVLVIRSISDKVVLSQYLFFILSQRSFFDEVMSYAIGTKMPRGDKAVIKAYQVSFPCDIMEQEAIISLLSSMDLDISALNDKLKKAHQIKQGMMQQLLTGNIRLA